MGYLGLTMIKKSKNYNWIHVLTSIRPLFFHFLLPILIFFSLDSASVDKISHSNLKRLEGRAWYDGY